MTARPSNPLNFALLSKPSDSASPDLPTDAGESTPGQTILSFQVHARRGLPVRHGGSETTVGRRREPPSQTILLFQVLSSARLTRPTRRLLKPSSDVGESLPARQSYLSSLTLGQAYPSDTGIVEATVGRRREPPSQTNSSFPSARTTISNPVERYVPGRSGNLSFQSTTGEVQPFDSRVSISRRMPQEPPGWTTSPFPPTSAKLTHQTGGHAHQWDDG